MLGNADYAHKTVLFCWEHHAIPLIFNRFGLNAALGLDEVFWGENPTTPVRCSLPVSHPCPKSAANSCTFCQRMLCM